MDPLMSPKAKVLFRVPNDDGTAEVETLWAYDLGGDQYKIANCPFFAYGVSLHDVVHAPFDAGEGFPTFQRVLTKSGNRTIRVIFDPPVEAGNSSDKVLDGLRVLGCDFERANATCVVVNIPPVVDLDAVKSYLLAQDADWENADPSGDELQSGGM
jgi:hypothetical protein